MIEKYIIVKDNIIISVLETVQGINAIKAIASKLNHDIVVRVDKSQVFPIVDENGFHLADILPHEGCIYSASPGKRGDMIAKWGGKWEYVDDIRGTYYHKKDKSKLEINTFTTKADLSQYTKLEPSENDTWDGCAWVFDYNAYGNRISAQLRSKCRAEREKYFPDTVKDNLIVGQTYDNKLLTVLNYNKLVSYYRGLVSKYEPVILSATTKRMIDDIYTSIIFPDEKMIMDIINAED